ncbi:hypothetical protein C8R44DRAFT_868983 [Mycena epipterygia]|nr:hypothetical protein C8R44DRAFT_868983 [Mycena epipterygia]
MPYLVRAACLSLLGSLTLASPPAAPSSSQPSFPSASPDTWTTTAWDASHLLPPSATTAVPAALPHPQPQCCPGALLGTSTLPFGTLSDPAHPQVPARHAIFRPQPLPPFPPLFCTRSSSAAPGHYWGHLPSRLAPSPTPVHPQVPARHAIFRPQPLPPFPPPFRTRSSIASPGAIGDIHSLRWCRPRLRMLPDSRAPCRLPPPLLPPFPPPFRTRSSSAAPGATGDIHPLRLVPPPTAHAPWFPHAAPFTAPPRSRRSHRPSAPSVHAPPRVTIGELHTRRLVLPSSPHGAWFHAAPGNHWGHLVFCSVAPLTVQTAYFLHAAPFTARAVPAVPAALPRPPDPELTRGTIGDIFPPLLVPFSSAHGAWFPRTAPFTAPAVPAVPAGLPHPRYACRQGPPSATSIPLVCAPVATAVPAVLRPLQHQRCPGTPSWASNLPQCATLALTMHTAYFPHAAPLTVRAVPAVPAAHPSAFCSTSTGSGYHGGIHPPRFAASRIPLLPSGFLTRLWT